MAKINPEWPKIAYFCMEFGLDESFHIYSGGLGILAGDILKQAKLSGYPMVGVGILWRQGYTSQHLDGRGRLYDCYYDYTDYYDFLRDTGVRVALKIRGRVVRCKVWECTEFGNVPLYLLDTNFPENCDPHITGQLYGWFSEERIAQEMVLGIGGVRALRALKLPIDLYHFNDSHPVFAGLELVREKMDQRGLSFEEAWQRTKKEIVFTTHTPVPAGNEVYSHEQLRYMGADNGLTYEQLLKLGGKPFSMTVAGLRLCKKASAVSKKHGITAQKMWSEVEGTSQIIPITNGVFNGTWQDLRIARAFAKEEPLWPLRQAAKRELIEEIYKRNGVRLQEDILTIGFARRMASYKRGDLIFKKPEEIGPRLKAGELQLIFSGKTHPNDLAAKEIVSEIYKMSLLYPRNVIFIQNYDMSIGRILTRGCDLWLNNPRAPMEASGTSGMKAAMNGVLNLSVLDGWWSEGCAHAVTGWQFGAGYQGANQDEKDLDALYRVLFTEVAPTYYHQRGKWEEMMRSSIRMANWRFSTARMLEEYFQELYL